MFNETYDLMVKLKKEALKRWELVTEYFYFDAPFWSDATFTIKDDKGHQVTIQPTAIINTMSLTIDIFIRYRPRHRLDGIIKFKTLSPDIIEIIEQIEIAFKTAERYPITEPVKGSGKIFIS